MDSPKLTHAQLANSFEKLRDIEKRIQTIRIMLKPEKETNTSTNVGPFKLSPAEIGTTQKQREICQEKKTSFLSQANPVHGGSDTRNLSTSRNAKLREKRREKRKISQPKKKSARGGSEKANFRTDLSKLPPTKLAKLQKARDLRREKRVSLQKQLEPAWQEPDYRLRRRKSISTAIEASAHPSDHSVPLDSGEADTTPSLSTPVISPAHLRSYIQKQLHFKEKRWVELQRALDRAIVTPSNTDNPVKELRWHFPLERRNKNYHILECLYDMIARTSEGTSLHMTDVLPTDDHPAFSWKEVEGKHRKYDVVERYESYGWKTLDRKIHPGGFQYLMSWDRGRLLEHITTHTGPQPDREALDGWLEDAMSGSGVGIFKRENWTEDDATYNIVAPAMSLAWKLLNTHRSLEWFDHVATGIHVPHPTYPGQHYIADSSWLSDPDMKRVLVRQVLTNLEALIRIKTFEGLYEGKPVWGYARIERLKPPYEPQLGTVPGDAIEMGINLIPIRYIAGHTPGSTAWKTWTYLMAQLLCHETAHAFYHCLASISNQHHCFSHEHPEPHYDLDEAFPDLGYSWESFVIGYHIRPVQATGMYSTGPVVLTANELPLNLDCFPKDETVPMPGHESHESGNHLKYVLPASWIEKWFEECTWKYVVEDGLHFMRREAKEYGLVTKKNWPYLGWVTHYIKAPFHVLTVPTMISKPGIDAPILLSLEWNVENARWESLPPSSTLSN